MLVIGEKINTTLKEAKNIVAKYPENHIENIIDSVKRTFEQKEISNVAAYLVKAIKNNWVIKSSVEVQMLLHEEKLDIHITASGNKEWQEVLSALLNTFGKPTYVSWFAKLSFSKYENNSLYLKTKTPFIKSYIEDNYIRHIQKYWNKTQNVEYTKIVIASEVE